MVIHINEMQYETASGHYTADELAEEIGAALPEVHAAIREGILPYIRGPSGEPLVPKNFVERWLFCS